MAQTTGAAFGVARSGKSGQAGAVTTLPCGCAILPWQGCVWRNGAHMERPHHLIVLVLDDVAMPNE